MDYKDIKKLIDDMGNSKLDSLKIEFPDGVKIDMKKNTVKEHVNVIEMGSPMTHPVVMEKQENSLVNIEQHKENGVIEKEENYKIVKSPMVGTFYASSSPDKDPYVKVGDKVQKGQVLCIVEAMKLMNEIESEFDGEVVEVCVKDGEMVDYGKPLFRIK